MGLCSQGASSPFPGTASPLWATHLPNEWAFILSTSTVYLRCFLTFWLHHSKTEILSPSRRAAPEVPHRDPTLFLKGPMFSRATTSQAPCPVVCRQVPTWDWEQGPCFSEPVLVWMYSRTCFQKHSFNQKEDHQKNGDKL